MSIEAIVILVIAVAVSAYFYIQKQKSKKKSKPIDGDYKMIYLRWAMLAVTYLLLLITLPVVAPVLSLFTRAMPYHDGLYEWGGWYGTWDNPPQGDEGFVEKRALFPGKTTGFKGYVNRVQWITRNKLYNFKRMAGVEYSPSNRLITVGNEDISDKYKIPGHYLSKYYDYNILEGFEFYMVKPWSKNRCIRCRIGWKMNTDKFKRYGFAALVVTFNPLDTYGDS